MAIQRIGLYRPAWGTDSIRESGHDEDIVTLAVAAATTVVTESNGIRKVVVITPAPDILEGFAGATILSALGLADTVPVDLQVGSGVATLTSLVSAPVGTLVIAVDAQAPAGAAAAVIDGETETLRDLTVVTASLPMRVRHTGSRLRNDYDDARLERERGWRPALERVLGREASEGPVAIVGPRARDAARIGSTVTVPTTGASAPLFALAELTGVSGATIVALDSGSVARVYVADSSAPVVTRHERMPQAIAHRPKLSEDDITDVPFSLPAYERAFAAKTGLLAGSCTCGTVDFPPRRYCSGCGRRDTAELVPLPRDGEVYTGVRIHVPVPGIAGPYALAIVKVDEFPIHVLAHVTDTPGADPVIGSRGRLVLRRVATREGVPDYGYAWQPAEEAVRIEEESA